MPYESIRKPGNPDFVPDSAGGLGGGIGSHAGYRMAYDARILSRITVGFFASGRLSLGRAFFAISKGRARFWNRQSSKSKAVWMATRMHDWTATGRENFTVCFTPLMHWRQF